jgi:hypothetical protein
MIPKISLTAAFFLLAAPPLACASTRAAANAAPMTCRAHQSQPGMMLAQDEQPSTGTTNSDDNSDNDSDANDNDNDNGNQNADSDQTDQNAAGDAQPIPPTVLGAPDNDQDEPQQAPMNSYPQPANPYQ